MIAKISNNLYTGSSAGLVFTNKDWFIVSASQKFHYYYLGWNHDYIDKSSKDYLFREFKNRLTLNWIDGPKHLFDWYTPEIFKSILDLIETNITQRKIFIHCDLGKSRGPSLCMLFMAKRLKLISNSSAEDAYMDFIKIYPQYNPRGIFYFLSDNWQKLI